VPGGTARPSETWHRKQSPAGFRGDPDAAISGHAAERMGASGMGPSVEERERSTTDQYPVVVQSMTGNLNPSVNCCCVDGAWIVRDCTNRCTPIWRGRADFLKSIASKRYCVSPPRVCCVRARSLAYTQWAAARSVCGIAAFKHTSSPPFSLRALSQQQHGILSLAPPPTLRDGRQRHGECS
jgi:hypothetical protein